MNCDMASPDISHGSFVRRGFGVGKRFSAGRFCFRQVLWEPDRLMRVWGSTARGMRVKAGAPRRCWSNNGGTVGERQSAQPVSAAAATSAR